MGLAAAEAGSFFNSVVIYSRIHEFSFDGAIAVIAIDRHSYCSVHY